MKVPTPFEQARLGLAYLSAAEGLKDLPKSWKAVQLSEHPFGLETNLTGRDERLGEKFRIVGILGATNISVEAMTHLLHDVLRGYKTVDPSPFRLRIIRVQIAKDWNDSSRYVHDVYFELIDWLFNSLCGGCTDCSGAGDYGRRRLEAMFNLIAAIYQIPVEEVIIPFDRHESATQQLKAAYSKALRQEDLQTV